MGSLPQILTKATIANPKRNYIGIPRQAFSAAKDLAASDETLLGSDFEASVEVRSYGSFDVWTLCVTNITFAVYSRYVTLQLHKGFRTSIMS